MTDTPDRAGGDVADGVPASGAFDGAPWAGRYAVSGATRRRMSDGRRRRRRVQRRSGAILIGLSGLMLVTAGWIVVTALMARSELGTVKNHLAELRQDMSSGDLADARAVAMDIGHHAHRAHWLTTGPAWYLVAAIPGVGDPVNAVRGIASAADTLGATTVPNLIDISRAVDPSQFSVTNHKIDITPLIQQTPTLDRVVRAADAQQGKIASLPQHTWLRQVNSAVTHLSSAVTQLLGTLHTVDRAAHAAPSMLGYSSPHRYFVGFQNEAEARGTGGLPGAFGILVASHGTVTFTHFGSDRELEGVDSGVDLGADYNNQWRGFEPTTQYLNSTVSPNYPDAARIWAATWQKKSGEHIDGALSLDPTALSYFLGAVGPATLPDGSQVTSRNVVALTQSTVYAKFTTDNDARKAYLLQIARSVDARVLSGVGSSAALFKSASRAAGERRLLLWDANPAIETTLSRTSIAGVIPRTSAPFLDPVVVNYAANKLDYYLDRTITWRATDCGSVRDVTVTLTLTNTAPANGLSRYVTGPPDGATRPGDNTLMLYYLGTTDGYITGATLDGKPVGTSNRHANGHPTYSMILSLPRASSRVIVLHLREPRSASRTVQVVQPLARGADISTGFFKCPG